jgi:hypothetical protein
MELNIKLIAFYSHKEIIIKDVEKDLYTKDRKTFHLFLFNNKNLHFKKSIIYNNSLIKEFDNIQAEFKFNKKKSELVMVKKIPDFNKKEFNKKVIENYNQYINNINYRIDCIFQTFTLFNNLYKDKILIFVFPFELYDAFLNLLKKDNLAYDLFLKNEMSHYMNYFEIVYWINYFFKVNTNIQEVNDIQNKNIKAIIKIN